MSEPYDFGYAECVLCGRVTLDPVYDLARGPSCRSHRHDTTDAEREAEMCRLIDQMEEDER